MKLQYANEFIKKLEIGDTTTSLYQLFYDENESVDTKIV